MAITFPATITGAAQTNFTAPTYTTTIDNAPDSNGKQVAIIAVGGTQAGVTAHSVSSPFTQTFYKPKRFKSLGMPNPVTGRVTQVPVNSYGLITRKGVTPLENQPTKPAKIATTFDIPAGADTYDAANVKAAIAAHIGTLWAIAAGIGDTSNSGVM